jgi:hypothetical protein
VNNSYKQNDYDVGYNLYTTKLNVEGRTVHWSPACFLERTPLAGWWVQENYSEFRQSYYVEYANGYPRNEFSDLNRVWTVDSSSVQVINETASVEIFDQNGWYRIPAQANIKIRKIIQLPNITNYDDSRVLTDNSNIPYSTPAYLDKQISWEIDTDISITRAVDTGSIDDVDDVSQSISTHGDGIVSYTISR